MLTTLLSKRLTAVITSLLWNCPLSTIPVYTYNTATYCGKACFVWLKFHKLFCSVFLLSFIMVVLVIWSLCHQAGIQVLTYW